MTSALGIAQGEFGRVALLDMDSSLVCHAHHHCHILLKAAGPDQSFIVGDQALPVRDDTAVLVNAWEQHQYAHPGGAARTLFLALYIEPAWIASAERSFGGAGWGSVFNRNCAPITAEIRRLRNRLAGCLASGGLPDSDMAALTGELVLAMIHRYAERPGAYPRRRRLQDFRIRRVLRHVCEQPQACVDLDHLARIAGLSRPRFNQLFRLCTGVSPGLYADALRVEQAVRTLTLEHCSIASVAERMGFSAQSNFSRFFLQRTGVTPRHFRQVAASLPCEPGFPS